MRTVGQQGNQGLMASPESSPRRINPRRLVGALALAVPAAFAPPAAHGPTGTDPAAMTPARSVRVEISFAPEARSESLTGRVYVALSRERGRERRGQIMGPIHQAGETGAYNPSDAVAGSRCTQRSSSRCIVRR